MIKLKALIISIVVPLVLGSISGFLTMNSMSFYKNLNRPFLSPPGILFPIVWSVLYILMGISSYMIYESNSPFKKRALTLYAVQLIVNVIWPIIFFNMHMYLTAFVWLLILWILVLRMIIVFYKIKPASAYLQIPYILWLTFAAYLNLGVYFLN